MKSVLLSIALLGCGAWGMRPELAKADASRRDDLLIARGKCVRLVVAGEPLEGCEGKLMNSVHRNGRTGFYFMAGNLTVTFSGLGPNQVKLNADNAVQPVDRIILNTGRDPVHPDDYRAVGSCRFSNPNKGPSTVKCQADTAKGRFEGTFVTDGEPPVSLMDGTPPSRRR